MGFRLVAALLCGCAFASGSRAADPLAEKIQAVIARPSYQQAHWGVLVADLKTGEPLFSHNAEKLFAPASTTKLYSCASALVAYGADYRFATPVYRRGELGKDGVLQGDLILVASGDPSFGGRTTAKGTLAYKNHDHTYANGSLDGEVTDTDPLAALNDLAKQIQSAGIKEVRGDVLIDDRLYAAARATGSGPDMVTPIMVNDNCVDVLITPGEKPGDPARVKIRPGTASVQLDLEMITGPKDGPHTSFVFNGWNRQVTVRGTTPQGFRQVVRIVSVDDPNAFARTLFIEALRRHGIRVVAPLFQVGESTGPLPPTNGYEKLTKVAEYQSPPMHELTKVILKVSHNLYASSLPCLVAVKRGKRTLEDGLREQAKILQELGVDVKTISFGGGAGGSVADFVTPQSAVQLLRGMSKRPEWSVYKNGMPELGVNGTLVDVVPGTSPARGQVFAKTGTLMWTDSLNDRVLLRSKALAGVLTTASGRELAFALFVNNVPLPAGVTPSREGKVLGELCEIIYQTVK